MSNLATISLNFSNVEKEIISVPDNTPDILAECIEAAAEGRTIYSISNTFQGCIIRKLDPGSKFHMCVSNYRNGEYTWYRDDLYAKHYSKDTAVGHVMNMYATDKHRRLKPTRADLYGLLNAKAEYHPEIEPLRSDKKSDLLEKYFYWVDEFNDGYDPHNFYRPDGY